MNIVIIEDEVVISLFLETILEELNHRVIHSFDNAQDLLNILKLDTQIDLIFMDINIKGSIDGIMLAKKVKETNHSIAIVFITSYQDSDTIQQTRDIKPIGYLIKPILKSHIESIMMIVETQISQQNKSKLNDEYNLGSYLYNFETKLLYFQNEVITMSINEINCLEILIKNRDSYTSAEQLMHGIWNQDKSITSLRELIHRVRKKIPKVEIQNIPNLGYRLCWN